MAKNPMPPERQSVTRKLEVGGLQSYITVGLYPDGQPGELFLVVERVGSLERGLAHTIGILVSMLLQRGVSVSEISEKLTGLQFEPRGVTGNPEIPMVSSIADYLGRWLQQRWAPRPE